MTVDSTGSGISSLTFPTARSEHSQLAAHPSNLRPCGLPRVSAGLPPNPSHVVDLEAAPTCVATTPGRRIAPLRTDRPQPRVDRRPARRAAHQGGRQGAQGTDRPHRRTAPRRDHPLHGVTARPPMPPARRRGPIARTGPWSRLHRRRRRATKAVEHQRSSVRPQGLGPSDENSAPPPSPPGTYSSSSTPRNTPTTSLRRSVSIFSISRPFGPSCGRSRRCVRPVG
jgi:hypothetical protein